MISQVKSSQVKSRGATGSRLAQMHGWRDVGADSDVRERVREREESVIRLKQPKKQRPKWEKRRKSSVGEGAGESSSAPMPPPLVPPPPETPPPPSAPPSPAGDEEKDAEAEQQR